MLRSSYKLYQPLSLESDSETRLCGPARNKVPLRDILKRLDIPANLMSLSAQIESGVKLLDVSNAFNSSVRASQDDQQAVMDGAVSLVDAVVSSENE